MLPRLKRTNGLSWKLFSDPRFAVIGKIIAPHGTGGMVKVYPYSDAPERINHLEAVEIYFSSGRRKVEVEKASHYGHLWLIKLSGVNTREDASRLRGGLIIIPLADRLPLSEDTFYHDQLVGLQVSTVEGEVIGLVVELISTGGHDLLLVDCGPEKAKKVLVPAVKRIVRQVDLAAGSMVVELPAGLLEL